MQLFDTSFDTPVPKFYMVSASSYPFTIELRCKGKKQYKETIG